MLFRFIDAFIPDSVNIDVDAPNSVNLSNDVLFDIAGYVMLI
jgi:hypothetical protein